VLTRLAENRRAILSVVTNGTISAALAAAFLAAGCSLFVSLDGLESSDGGASIDASTDATEAADGSADALADSGVSDATTRNDAAGYSAVVLADGPVAYYRLDDSSGFAHDSTSSHLDGTYGADVEAGVAGLIDGDPDTAIRITRATPEGSSFIQVANSATLEPADLSVEVWLRPELLDELPMVVYGESYQLYMTSTGFAGNFNGSTVPADFAVATGSTYYFVLTSAHDTGQQLFLNGTLIGSNNVGTNVYTHTDVLTIGADTTGGAGPNFVGRLDEVAIYNKILTPAQIQAHYAAGK
jgi:concanavalin A-like lectin/glucanase superfamily protein